MSRYNDLRDKNKELHKKRTDTSRQLNSLSDEIERVAGQFGNAGAIISDLDHEFSETTGICNEKDMKFLFIATGLLTAKWLIMSHVAPLDFDFTYKPKPKEERLTHNQGDELVEEKLKSKTNGINKKVFEQMKYDEEGYRTWQQILLRPVPYDAMVCNDISLPVGLNGKNHHAYTLGHDPVFGWIFGTINIITRSLTMKQPFMPTYLVHEKGNVMYAKSDLSIQIYNAFKSVQEDNKRFPFAVVKQSWHFLADKYTITGLPIPLIPADKAQELIEMGWNSVEAGKAIKKVAKVLAKDTAIVGIQFLISFIINEIIKALHLLCYDSEEDGDIKLYQVRTRKILLASNCISSCSNILYSAGVTVVKKDLVGGLKKLDIGGFIETIHRLYSETEFITNIKKEYICENFANRVLDTDFQWLYN